MFAKILRHVTLGVSLNSSKCAFQYRSNSDFKVTVMGASGGIGFPLCLQLKQCPLIEELSVCDIANAHAVGRDISLMDTKSKVTAFSYPGEACKALTNARVVVLVAGNTRKPGMTRDDLFNVNACLVKCMAENCVKYCPQAALVIVTNPVNSTVPIVSEVFRKANKNNDNRIFGFTTLDLVRASTFAAIEAEFEPENVSVPVVGGHSEPTIVPLFSQMYPHAEFQKGQVYRLTRAVKEAGAEVVKAKGGTGSATLSTAFALSRFTVSVVKGLQGHINVVECSFVRSNVRPECSFLSTPVELGAVGIKRNLGLPHMNEYENCLLTKAIPYIQKDIAKGIKFVHDVDLAREREEKARSISEQKLKCSECIC